MKTPSVVVIGAGIGGIAAAAHLARRGLHVTIVEKNSRPGGRFDRFSRDGHHFDAGPTLLVMRLLYETEFAALGVSLGEMMDLQRVDPTYHLVFDDASQLALTSDMNAMREQLERIEPGSFHGFLRYVEEGSRHYHLALDRLVNRDFRKATDFFSLANLPLMFQVKPFTRHYSNMSAYFDHPRLKTAFTFQDVYMGLRHVPDCGSAGGNSRTRRGRDRLQHNGRAHRGGRRARPRRAPCGRPPDRSRCRAGQRRPALRVQ
jgi:phytoene desaturase